MEQVESHQAPLQVLHTAAQLLHFLQPHSPKASSRDGSGKWIQCVQRSDQPPGPTCSFTTQPSHLHYQPPTTLNLHTRPPQAAEQSRLRRYLLQHMHIPPQHLHRNHHAVGHCGHAHTSRDNKHVRATQHPTSPATYLANLGVAAPYHPKHRAKAGSVNVHITSLSPHPHHRAGRQGGNPNTRSGFK